MQTGHPSRTALGVAHRRAVHQLLDRPPILADPIAIPLLGPQFATRFAEDRERQQHPYARAFRAFMAVRSRYAEDNLAASVAAGVTQYVILGAGLDTFAYRNPHPVLRVFEVDFPATQAWKRELLHQAAIPEPSNLTYVPLDFEHRTLAEGLSEAGFDPHQPAFFCWLGVVPYLTLRAFRSTIDFIASLPPGSGVTFDYALSEEELSPARRRVRQLLVARVAAVGEPFQLFFRSEQLENELKSAGLQRIEQLDTLDVNSRYFANRTDGLALPEEGLGKLATAWVE
jgi:methyltransferase (TIGR00027 family)